MARRYLNRMIQQMDQTLGRAEKSEVLTKNMDEISQTLQLMEELCQTLSKRLREVIPDSGGKRKKTPEEQLALTMRECGKGLGSDSSTIGILLNKAAEIEECLAKEQVQFDVKEDEQVLRPMITLDDEYRKILKQKKHLAKLTLDMDAARKKYNNAIRQSSVPASDANASKLSSLKEEMDELVKQVDHERDVLTTDMLLMTSREADFTDLLMKHIQLKAEYHQQALKVFESLIPDMKTVSEKCIRPLFGSSLRDHLYRNNRKIAYVLECCAEMLAERGLFEEGLFRLAGSTSKVKMLKAAFDAQTESALNLIICDADHHSVAATLKSYLRELPEPLTTTSLYDDWMDAIRIDEHEERCKALVHIIDHLPTENRDNLSYLFKFLALVASNSEKNKMTAGNLAIVMAPNLFWNGISDRSQFDMSANSLFHSLVEFMIKYQKEIFPGEWESSYDGIVPRNNPELSNDAVRPESPGPITPPEIPISPKSQPKNNSGMKKKPAPAIPPVPPKRTDQLPPKHSNPSAPPETPASPPVSNIYPDITCVKIASAAPIVSFEPTVVPVPYNPPQIDQQVNQTQSLSPAQPAPRRRVVGSASSRDPVHSRSSSDGGQMDNGDVSIATVVLPLDSKLANSTTLLDSKLAKPPVVPPRQISENNTYL